MKCADIFSHANKFTIIKEISDMIRFLNIWTNKLRPTSYPKDHKYEIKTPPFLKDVFMTHFFNLPAGRQVFEG
jgi:hypothetical protein